MLIYTNKCTGHFQKSLNDIYKFFYCDVDAWVGRRLLDGWMSEVSLFLMQARA